MGGYIWETDKPDSRDSTLVRGVLSLTADFDDSTVSGTIDGIETQAPGQTAYQASAEVLTISAGSITDSTFTADLTGTGAADSRYEGDVDGQFFGPTAEEVGGVLEATHTGNRQPPDRLDRREAGRLGGDDGGLRRNRPAAVQFPAACAVVAIAVLVTATARADTAAKYTGLRPLLTDMQAGRLLIRAGRLDHARVFLLKAKPSGEEERIERLFLLGRIEMRLGMPREAVTRFEKIIEMRPDLTRVRLELAQAFYLLGQHDNARRLFRDALGNTLPSTVEAAVRGFPQADRRAEAVVGVGLGRDRRRKQSRQENRPKAVADWRRSVPIERRRPCVVRCGRLAHGGRFVLTDNRAEPPRSVGVLRGGESLQEFGLE